MRRSTIVLGLLSCLAATLPAQEPCYVVDGKPMGNCAVSARPNAPTDDPLARYLFPPELVMSHQQAIGLTDRQRTAIVDAIKDAQGKFIDLQFRMSAEMEKLQQLIQGTSVDEIKVLDQLDRLLAAEREIKHAQLTLMIRVKNQLTEQQQTALTRLRQPQTIPVRPF